jgi:hypothetical protein
MYKNISLLSKVNIKSGKLFPLIPEFYDLKDVVENNDWHHKQNVFNHTLSVLDNLDKALRDVNKAAKQFLNKKIGTITRKKLLQVAALFHDIAKKETIASNNNSAYCPNHEARGSIKTKKILKRFKLSDKELTFILSIIKHYGLVHKMSTDNRNFQRKFTSFKKKFFHSIYPELILLTFADTMGSDLAKTRPTEFKFRISFYKKEISNLPPKK